MSDVSRNNSASPSKTLRLPTKRPPVTARRVVIAGARVVAGAVGIGIAVVTIAASALVPWPSVSSVPPSVVVVPVPTAQQLVCSGAVLRLADDIGQGATTASAIGAPSIRYSSSSGSVDATYLGAIGCLDRRHRECARRHQHAAQRGRPNRAHSAQWRSSAIDRGG